MNQTDLRVDHYISRSEPFAVEILEHIRHIVHRVCPDVEEVMKWSFPHFIYRGSNLCSMASFKAHCAFGFWLGPVMEDPHGLFVTEGDEKAMGQLGRIRSLKDLPADKILAEYIMQAVQLIDSGVKLSKKPAAPKGEIIVPGHFRTALDKHPPALDFFNRATDSQKREYINWINEAKTEATRTKRVETSIEWLGEGKTMNWKYKK